MFEQLKRLEQSTYQKYLAYVQDFALSEFKKGNYGYGNILQGVMAEERETTLQTEIASAYEECLAGISTKELIRLSEGFRDYFDDEWITYTRRTNIDWANADVAREKFPHLTDCQYFAVLKFGTFMADGYYRQRCMEALGDAEGSLPFILLRLNDWVGEIQESAFRLAKRRLEECGVSELFMALPVLEKVEGSGRRSDGHILQIKELTEKALAARFDQIAETALEEIHGYEIHVKNALYRFVRQNKVLGRERMKYLLRLEKTGYGKMLLILGIFAHYGYGQDEMEQYLSSGSAIVRYHALVFRYENEHNAWAGLEEMLFDRSKRIRDYAAYIIEKHTGKCILNEYRERMSVQPSREALLGIGEHGSEKDIGCIIPFLEAEEEVLVRAALEAYGRLAAESGSEFYWKFLCGSRPVLVRQAYRIIRKYRVHFGAEQVYQAFLKSRGKMAEKYFLELLLGEPSWERLPYLLMLYGDRTLGEDERGMVLAGMGGRHLYTKISSRQGQWIEELLARQADAIPEQVRKGILFDLKYVVSNH